jgi:hypothetical protein
MVAFSAFTPYITPEMPDCPLVLVEDTIRDACRAFSADTWLIREDLATFNTVVGTQSYTLSPAAMTEVLGVNTVILEGKLPALSLGSDDPSKRYVPQDGRPSEFWFWNGKLWFDTEPDSVVTVKVDAVTRPTYTATTVDSKYEEYRDAIAFWTKYRLKSIPGKPWTDPQGAAACYQHYTSIVGKQRAKNNSGGVARPLRAVASFF